MEERLHYALYGVMLRMLYVSVTLPLRALTVPLSLLTAVIVYGPMYAWSLY